MSRTTNEVGKEMWLGILIAAPSWLLAGLGFWWQTGSHRRELERMDLSHAREIERGRIGAVDHDQLDRRNQLLKLIEELLPVIEQHRSVLSLLAGWIALEMDLVVWNPPILSGDSTAAKVAMDQYDRTKTNPILEHIETIQAAGFKVETGDYVYRVDISDKEVAELLDHLGLSDEDFEGFASVFLLKGLPRDALDTPSDEQIDEAISSLPALHRLLEPLVVRSRVFGLDGLHQVLVDLGSTSRDLAMPAGVVLRSSAELESSRDRMSLEGVDGWFYENASQFQALHEALIDELRRLFAESNQ